MEILIYKRVVKTNHIHNTLCDTIIYVPTKKKMLYKSSQGTFSPKTYGISDVESIINEAEFVYNNNIPDSDEVEVLDIRRIECLDEEIDDVIEIATKSKEFAEKTKENIEKYLKK